MINDDPMDVEAVTNNKRFIQIKHQDSELTKNLKHGDSFVDLPKDNPNKKLESLKEIIDK